MAQTARKLQPRAPVNVNDIVRDAMEEFANNKDKVIEALMLRVGDRDVNDAFRILGLKQAVRSFQTGARHGSSEAPSADPHFSDDRRYVGGSPVTFTPRPRRVMSPEEIQVRADASVARKLWWDNFMLFGGHIPLPKATYAQLAESNRQYAVLAKGNDNMNKFGVAILSSMDPKSKKLVEDQVKPDQALRVAQRCHVRPE